MSVLDAAFIHGVLRDGKLSRAQARTRDGSARPANKAAWDQLSTWALICEEILDTEREPEWYDDIVAELARRGLDDETVNRMRAFAWMTAGWLNYDMMLWEWVSLDEDDIVRALNMQRSRGLISPAQLAERLLFVEHPDRIPQLGELAG